MTIHIQTQREGSINSNPCADILNYIELNYEPVLVRLHLGELPTIPFVCDLGRFPLELSYLIGGAYE